MSKGKLLIVDDEQSMRDLLCIMLRKEGYDTRVAGDGQEALELFKREGADVVLEDLKMPGMDGIKLLEALKEIDPKQLVIVMTAYSTWETAVNAMRLGAYDYIKKPFDNEVIKQTVARAVSHNEMLRNRRDEEENLLPTLLVGYTQRMQEVWRLIRRAAPTDSTVLILGESGTGKEVVARMLHQCSLRAEYPFITMNSTAFPEALLESELFGHVKGAFTNALADKKGLVEIADGGTFFLDEIGELTLEMQVKLLRLLEEKEFKPVGSTETKKADVRFVTASNRDLEKEVERGNFRQDLFFRLNVIQINLPPLRERREDIPLFAGHFLARYCSTMGREISRIDKEALAGLMSYDWPGNIRELENVIQRAVALAEGDAITLEDLPEKFASVGAPEPSQLPELPAEGLVLEDEIEKIERHYIRQALERTGWSLTKAAKLLGMSFRSMRYKAGKLGLKPAKQSKSKD